MKRLIVVAIAVVAIAASVLLRRNGAGTIVGVVVGTWYFLQGVSSGGGIAGVRLTRDPSAPVRAQDPNGSIGMGLAVAGIAAAVLADKDYAPYHDYFVFFLIAGLIIALVYAGKTVVADRLSRRGGSGTSGLSL